MRHAGDGLWEEVRIRAQQEVEASAQSVREVLGEQAQEMRYMVSVLKGCTGLEHTSVSNTMHLQMDELLHDTAGKVSLYFWAHDHLLT
jgi:RNase adaptor protein for sRNA GlmZ degradation